MPPGLNDDDGARVGHHSAHDVVVEPLPQIIAGDVAIRLRAVLQAVVDAHQVRAAAGDRTAAADKGDQPALYGQAHIAGPEALQDADARQDPSLRLGTDNHTHTPSQTHGYAQL